MESGSPVEYDEHASDVDSADAEEHEVKQESGSTQDSPSAVSNADAKLAPAVKPPLHLQKRRRVTRACDECRRKKIKCDGKQPCTHCTVYSYDCTYDQPSNRRRNPAPQYVENLEHRVHRAEALLHILIPNLDLNDPGIDAAVAQGWIPGAPGKGDAAAALQSPNGTHAVSQDAQNKSDTDLESMVRAVAQMDVDEAGHWDYHGHSSGLSFMRRMREQLGDLMGPETVSSPFIKIPPRSRVIESPRSAASSPATDSSGSDLPPKEIARTLCGHALNDAAALMRVVHQPSFWESFDRLYTVPPDHWTNADSQFLPLFHTAIAVGHLFGRDEGYQSAIDQGFAHFKTARQMMDIADCRDISSLQAIIFMVLFLQSSAKLSQCYAYVGVALRCALRMGLHRAYTGTFNPIEIELRKRVFWSVRKLDIYICTMIGLPLTLDDEDIDQDFPMEIDDEYLTKDRILPMPEGNVSLLTAFNVHTRLVHLLSKIVRKVYPIKAPGKQAADKTYSVPFSVIREIESDLEAWKNALPATLSPSSTPSRYTRVQQLLRLSYAHAQVMLYRPFLHFTARDKRSNPIDQRAYACAASYINVSRNIIHITAHMKQKGLLNGALWFIPYTTFFSILSLVYFAAENPDNPTTQAVMNDARQGKEVLAALARRSMAADRCTTTLNIVFQRLPHSTRDGRPNPSMPKKRQLHSGPQHTPRHQQVMQAPRSVPDLSNAASLSLEVASLQPRSNTFPHHNSPMAVTSSPTSFEGSWMPSGPSPFAPSTPMAHLDMDPSMHINTQTPPNNLNPTIAPFSAPNYTNPAMNDFSAMMFPAPDEPFMYPNQPLTTFENNRPFANDADFSEAPNFAGADAASPAAPPTLRGADDHLEAQFFALPPYIQERQQQLHQLHQLSQQRTPQPHQPQQAGLNLQASGLDFGGGHGMSAPADLQIPNGWAAGVSGGSSNVQQSLRDINFQDLFGGAEWNGMGMAGPAAGFQGL